MNTQIIILTLLAISSFLFTSFYLLLLIDSLSGHTLPTSNKVISEICKIIETDKPESKNFYDLGCARGKLALEIKKRRPDLLVRAIDKSELRIFFAKLKNIFLRRKIEFIKQDIFQIDLSNADVLYTYLWWDLLPSLKEKFFRELKKGSLVISNTSFDPSWVPTRTIILNPKNPEFEKIFIYRIG
jgi:SAM-dependent methyltransferase